VEQRDIRFSVPAAGEIGPAEQVSVKPEINGKIDELPVDIGDDVKKGQLLFKLDDKELQNERASAETEVQRANLQLQQAERNYKRAQELFEENLIAKELFENSKTEYELAKNARERAQRDLAIIEERLTKTTVKAPFDCTILTRPVSIGQAVSGSGGFNSGTEVLTIADLNNLVINAHINQADITRLRQDQEVDVQVEAVAGLKVHGKV
jgi:HlyD family secretion protein